MGYPEFLVTNLLDGAALSHSSEESSLPAENIQNLARTKKWRSDSGWNIVAGVNDKLDFDDGGGEENATLDAGNYATAALMGAEVKAKIEDLTGDTITVTYSGGRKFTIASDGGTFELLWSSGANAATSCGEDLGYDTSADDDVGTSHEADAACRCSREWIGIDLAAAIQCKRCAIVSHNFSSAAVVKLYRHTADTLSAATLVGTLTYDADFMVLEFDATYQYWWIHVDDIDNSDSYVEIGRAFLGTLTQPTKAASIYNYALIPVDDSPISVTPAGVVGKHVREQYHRVAFHFASVSESNRDTLLSIYRGIGAFSHFFFRPDPGQTLHSEAKLGGMYGYFIHREPTFGFTSPHWWSVTFTFEEAR